MARSPPSTATYMLVSLRDQPRGPRYRNNRIIMDQHDIDAARKQRRVDGKPFEQVRRPDGGLQHRDAIDAGPAQFEHGTLRQAFDLQDRRRRAMGRFAAAEG